MNPKFEAIAALLNGQLGLWIVLADQVIRAGVLDRDALLENLRRNAEEARKSNAPEAALPIEQAIRFLEKPSPDGTPVLRVIQGDLSD